MEAAAQDRAGWRRVVGGLYAALRATRHTSSKSSQVYRYNHALPLLQQWRNKMKLYSNEYQLVTKSVVAPSISPPTTFLVSNV